jgi:hypothetical protein
MKLYWPCDLKASDGTVLKGSYFAAAKPGPGVLLLHQINRTRKAWDDLAGQLAAAGINTLTLDIRGFGESGGKPDKRLTDARDIDTAFQYLVSQPGVKRDVIGVGGAGSLGVDRSVELARQRSAQVKSLVLLSVTASNPGKKLVHYSASQDAPWIWYEPFDIGKVPANGSHGTDLFKIHPELPGIIVDWFVTTLIKTPGHAPADTVASAPILDQIRMPGGVVQVTQQLTEARRRDPKAQLFPEITVSIIGQDHIRAGEPKLAVEVLELDLLAYPESADANETLAEAYLADGQKDLARQHAEKALAILDSHTVPASSWTDTEPYRGEIRRSAQQTLKKLDQSQR